MFGNMNKPAFGSTPSSTAFGFGTASTTNASPFGQSQMFGKPATGFGSPSTSAFGQTTGTSLFPSTQSAPTNLFQNANTTFGAQPTTQTGFGSTGLFGQPQPTNSGLFNTTTSFGQQAKPAGFGFGTPSTQPSLFGQPQQQPQTSTLFQSPSNTLFGGNTSFGGQQATGTVIKFNPVSGTDTMMKNGVQSSINTKHHSITCMKEYDNKSFEELRFEDYVANRKGPQQQSGFGAAPFGAPVSSTPSLFGQPDAAKPGFGQNTAFGQANTTFGQTTGFGMGAQQQQTSLFGKPTAFGAPTSSTSTFGFGTSTQNANPFGATQAKPFGSTAQPLFGTTTNTTQSGFGTGLFGQTNVQSNSLFGKPAQPTTGFGGVAPSTGFSFSTPASTQATSLFGQTKPLFGQPTTNTGFGQSTGFGAANPTPFGSNFAKPATAAFGTTQTPGFGTTLTSGIQPQTTSLFGNTAAKPGGLFGNTNTTGLFGNSTNTFQPTTGFGMQPQNPQQSLFPSSEQQNNSNLALLTTDPFGDAPHLAGLEPKLKSNSNSISATDPKELKSLLDSSKKVDTSNNSKLKVVPIKNVRDSLFDGISPKNDEHSGEYTKTNYRRLILKHRPSGGGDGIARTDILKLILSKEENKENQKSEIENDSGNKELRTAPVKLSFDNTIGDNTIQTGSQTYNIVNNSLGRNESLIVDRSHGDTSEIDDIDDHPLVNLSNSLIKEHPCGIICTRPEYYTLPTPEELPQYLDESGACIVKGFTVGRKGYGNVYFPDEMDIAGLNIDELVHFRYREINVYPDDTKKPPVGQGLNRKAQITLDNVYPKKPGANVLIKDVDELLQMNFAEKLRKITVKKDAKFVDYRPETGSWVFKVDHFSRYGFNDSDEEGEAACQDPSAKKNIEIEKLDMKRSTKITNQEPPKLDSLKHGEQSKEDKQKSKYGIEDDIFIDDNDQFPGDDDILHQSMYVDHVSEDEYRIIPTDIPMHISYDPYKTSKSVQIMKSTLFADDDRSSDGGGSHVSIIRQYLDLPDEVVPRLPLIKETVPRKSVIVRPKVDKIYTFADCIPSYKTIPPRNYQDATVFKGKSFKVGWNKGFQFYCIDDYGAKGSLSINNIICGSRKDLDPLQDILTDALEIVLNESTVRFDNQNIPTFEIIRNHTYLKKQSSLFSKISNKYNNNETKYMHSIWTLCEALWGPSEDSISNRRYLLSEWLKEYTSYDEKSIGTSIEDIFKLLTVFKSLEAASLSMEKKCPNLALLISQLSLTNRTKFFLQEQIESWYNSLATNHITENMKKIYLLLSGIPVKDEVNIFHDIDWKRAFGMHLWYLCPAGAPIENAIDLYKKGFEEHSYAEFPKPPYCQSAVDETPYDILYHILILYKTRVHRLSSALNPLTHTDDNLDYRLSWLLLQLFLSLEVGIIDTSEKNKLCISFANQLESLGQWEWSVFTLLHLDDNVAKKMLVVNILERNLSQETDERTSEVVNNLVNRMHIPPEWIHVVKGEKMLLSERYFMAFNHLALAKDYYRANNVLVEHLLPNLFINEQYDIIKMFISQIQSGADNILHWNVEAGLFLDFLDLQEKVISLNFEDLLRLQSQLQSISERLSSFVIKNEQQKLCIAEMSQRCASVYEELCKKSRSNLFKSVYAEFVETLVMPPDFKRNEALGLINNSYISPSCF